MFWNVGYHFHWTFSHTYFCMRNCFKDLAPVFSVFSVFLGALYVNLQYFQIFFIFTYNESLPKKSYQFFKINKSFRRKKKKTLRKVALCFITGCFIKPFKMIMIFSQQLFLFARFFFILKVFRRAIFAFWCHMTHEIWKGGIENSK